ncbi:MAG: GNAT family N-acetyltransferase [Anaerolineae bacterium]|nr:GNAT family N-acetyltransferase [Anaerolineae bacterium]
MTDLIYCPICGHTLGWKDVGGRTRQSCDNCGYVRYVNPVPAVGIVIEAEGGVVLIRRGQPPHQGEWTLPSGFIEADESAEDAAIREAEEETGLKVEVIEMMGINSFPEGPPMSGIMIFYRVKPVSGHLQGGDDAIEARIFQPNELPRLPFRTHREAIAQWLAHHEHPLIEPPAEAPAFIIRPAEARDREEVMALLALIPANRDLGEAEWREVELRYRESAGFEVFVAEAKQTPPIIIGFIVLSIVRTLTGRRGFINDMAVLPTYQRQGVGAALLEGAVRRADRMNLRSLMVNSARASERARAFYTACGFDEEAIMHFKIR